MGLRCAPPSPPLRLGQLPRLVPGHFVGETCFLSGSAAPFRPSLGRGPGRRGREHRPSRHACPPRCTKLQKLCRGCALTNECFRYASQCEDRIKRPFRIRTSDRTGLTKSAMIARASLTKSLHSSWWAKSVAGRRQLSWGGRSPGAGREDAVPSCRQIESRTLGRKPSPGCRNSSGRHSPRSTISRLVPASDNRPGHLAASLFCFASSAAKWRATALAAAALRLALNPSLLTRIQSIDCERRRLRSSKRGNT
jgi:hypothetical protein